MQRMSDMLTSWLEGTVRRAETNASSEPAEEPSASTNAVPAAEASEQFLTGINCTASVHDEASNIGVSHCGGNNMSNEVVDAAISNVDAAAVNCHVTSASSAELPSTVKGGAGSCTQMVRRVTETNEIQNLPSSDICTSELMSDSLQHETLSVTGQVAVAETSISLNVPKSAALKTANTAEGICCDNKQVLVVGHVFNSEYEVSGGTVEHSGVEPMKDFTLSFSSGYKEEEVCREKSTGTGDSSSYFNRSSDQISHTFEIHTSPLQDVDKKGSAGNVEDATICPDDVAKCDELDSKVLHFTPSELLSRGSLELPVEEINASEETAGMLANKKSDGPVGLTTSQHAACASHWAASTEVSDDSRCSTTNHCASSSCLQASSTTGISHYFFVFRASKSST